ncbi:MAG: dockerin type I domain-containing protein, partial [Tepidisphaerales bacterium]
GSGNDTITVYPRDADGNPTILGNLGMAGGAGSDVLNISDTLAAVGTTWTTSNPFGPGSQDFTVAGDALIGAVNDIETINLYGSSGNDTFNVNTYQSGNALNIYGGDGNDTLNVGNDNLAATVTSISEFTFDGQGGFNTFNLNNASDPNGWLYATTVSMVTAQRSAPAAAYFVGLTQANVEQMTINAGPIADGFTVNGLAAGESLYIHAGGGNDILGLPSSSSAVQGTIYYDGGAGNNVIQQLYSISAVPVVVHLQQASLGALPGDTFFGPGGALYFDAVTSILITLGNGADTACVQPNTTAAITIRGGSPTTAPGDTLLLALATAISPVITPTVPGSGIVTSDNCQPVNYSGFETGPIRDDSAPQVVGWMFGNGNVAPAARAAAPMAQSPAIPQLVATFSEPLVADPGPAVLQLFELTTGTVVSATLTGTAYDPVAGTETYTFADGLPAGIYQATLAAGALHDVAGNASAAGSVYTFVYVPDGGALAMPPGSGPFSVQQVSIGVGATFDIADNVIVLDGAAVAPGNLAAVQSLLSSEFAMTGWDGTGIVSGGLPPIAMTFNGGAGSNTLLLAGTTAAQSLDIEPALVAVNGTVLPYAGTTPVMLDGPAGQVAGFTSVAISASLGLAPSRRMVFRTSSLAITDAGRLDLAGNGMLLDYDAVSPVQGVRQWVQNGRIGVTPALVTSAAVASGTPAVAMVDNALLHLPSFNGHSLGGVFSQVLVACTVAGDTNLDGVVDELDYLNVLGNMGASGAQWFQGDVNCDGVVNADDIAEVTANLGMGSGAGPLLATPAAQAAPKHVARTPVKKGPVPKTKATPIHRKNPAPRPHPSSRRHR